MDLQHNPYTPLYVLGFIVAAVVVVRVLFGNRDVISDQREVARRRANWKGTNGPEARQNEVIEVRANWVGKILFGVALVVCSLLALAATVAGR